MTIESSEHARATGSDMMRTCVRTRAPQVFALVLFAPMTVNGILMMDMIGMKPEGIDDPTIKVFSVIVILAALGAGAMLGLAGYAPEKGNTAALIAAPGGLVLVTFQCESNTTLSRYCCQVTSRIKVNTCARICVPQSSLRQAPTRPRVTRSKTVATATADVDLMG